MLRAFSWDQLQDLNDFCGIDRSTICSSTGTCFPTAPPPARLPRVPPSPDIRHMLHDSVWTALLWRELHNFRDFLLEWQDNLLHDSFLGTLLRRKPQGEFDRPESQGFPERCRCLCRHHDTGYELCTSSGHPRCDSVPESCPSISAISPVVLTTKHQFVRRTAIPSGLDSRDHPLHCIDQERRHQVIGTHFSVNFVVRALACKSPPFLRV